MVAKIFKDPIQTVLGLGAEVSSMKEIIDFAMVQMSGWVLFGSGAIERGMGAPGGDKLTGQNFENKVFR